MIQTSCAYIPIRILCLFTVLQDEATTGVAEFPGNGAAAAVVALMDFWRCWRGGCVSEGGHGDFGCEAVIGAKSFLEKG